MFGLYMLAIYRASPSSSRASSPCSSSSRWRWGWSRIPSTLAVFHKLAAVRRSGVDPRVDRTVQTDHAKRTSSMLGSIGVIVASIIRAEWVLERPTRGERRRNDHRETNGVDGDEG